MSDDAYKVERSTVIAAPPERIYAQLADFHNWTAWSPWEGLDPDLQRTYSGAERGTGAAYGWSGNRRAGRGRMEITDTTEPSRVEIDVRFEKPFRSRSRTVFTVTSAGADSDGAGSDSADAGSRVTWTMTGDHTRMSRLTGLIISMDKVLGKEFERGLTQLKDTTELPLPT